MGVFIRLSLIGIGIVFLFLAAAGALLSLAKSYKELRGQSKESTLEHITKLIDAVTALIKALTSAPRWLILGLFGIVLILLGAFIPFPF